MLRGPRTRPAVALAALVALSPVLAGCGGGGTSSAPSARPAAATTTASAATTTTPSARRVDVVHRDDVEAGSSSPLPAGERGGRAAPSPTTVGRRSAQRTEDAQGGASAASGISPGAPSDAEVRAELEEMHQVQRKARIEARRAGPTAPLDLTPAANAQTPDNAPPAIAAIIASANAIARFPYVYGGGHASFVDSAYDCSGSVSYALAGAGLLSAPLTSGQLADWGDPGPGRWVTIYANAGHTFMYVAGTRYDTSGRSGVHGSRWQTAPRSLAGFTVRHPPGL